LGETEIQALYLSLKVSIVAVGLSLPVALLTAWVLARLEFPGKIFFDGFIHLPLVLPPVVVGYLLLELLGRNSVLGAWLYDTFDLSFVFSWRGAALAAAVMSFPLIVRAIRLSIESIDRRLENMARTLGAAPLRVFVTVTLPLAFPGIISGTILGLARCLGEFGATITFAANVPGETNTLPLAIYSVLQTPDGEAAAIRLSLIAVVLALAALAGSEIWARRLRRQMER